MHSFKILNLKLKILLRSRSGQSLAEVMIGLAIGAILIGAASFAITTTLKTNLTTQRSQFAANAAQETIERVRAFASSDWQNIYGLTKGSSTQYYFVATGTQFFVNQGKEGVIENDIRSGLVGQWGFDEATGTVAYDMTGNRNSGSFSVDPTQSTSTCKVGNCLNYNGTTGGVVSITSSSSLNFSTSSFSVSMWGFHRDFTYPKTWFMINKSNGCYVAGRPGWDIGHGFNSSGINICYSDGVNGSSNRSLTFESQYRPDAVKNKWTHLVIVFDTSSHFIKAYVNSIKQTQELDISTITGSVNNSNSLNIGGMYGWKTDGFLDDVRIYNRALSADEVKQLYNSATYSRYFYVENGCRTNDASSTYSGVSPCGGGSVDDPSSQKISSVVQWGTGGTGQIILADILTRWKNAIFQQSDWSGGVSENVLINSGTTFASSSNVNSGGGSLRINGL